MTCFEILGLARTASETEIKAKWRELCRIHHPDRGGNSVDFMAYREAYNAAMKLASAPVTCPHCGGSGKIMKQHGVTVTRSLCRPCSGRGVNARPTIGDQK